MKYCLSPELRKITSQVSVRIHGMPEMQFSDGNELVKYKFDKPYVVERIYENVGGIVIELVEKKQNCTNWIGEEQVSFF